MTTPKTPTPDIRLLLTTGTSRLSPASTITKAELRIAKDTPGGLRSPLYTGYGAEQDFDALDSFTISAQANLDDDAPYFYGWEIGYRDPHWVGADRAASIAATLRKVQRRLDKLQDRFGSPQDFAEYAGRVADALGATGAAFGRRTDRDRDYNGTGYQWGTVDSLRWWLADAIKAGQPGAEVTR